MLGLKKGTVALFPHETEWEEEAQRTIAKLKSALAGVFSDIQHVGSTSVKTICAKPIIDIAVAVRTFEDVLNRKNELEANGFYFRPCELDNQLLFACGNYYEGTGEEQTHFIHIVIAGSVEWQNYLLFRDCLNADPAAAAEYETLKLKLAEECPADPGREHYLAGKKDFIAKTIRKALIERFLGKKVKIEIDRPIGYIHEKDNYTLVYPVNYGYIPGVYGGDGEELDLYLLGVNEPVKAYSCRIIGAVVRKNDIEDKLIAAPEGIQLSAGEMYEMVKFQEKWYDTLMQTADRS